MGVKLQGLRYTAYPPLHTYHFCLSQFLKLAVSTESQPQLILLVLHFASGFLFLSALSYFHFCLLLCFPILSLCLLHMTLFPTSWSSSPGLNFSFVPLSVNRIPSSSSNLPIKSMHGFELSIDSKLYSQRLGEIWLCLPITMRNEVSWHDVKHEGFCMVKALQVNCSTLFHHYTTPSFALHNLVPLPDKETKLISVKCSPFVFFLESFCMSVK